MAPGFKSHLTSALGPLDHLPSTTGGFPMEFYDQMLTDSLIAGTHRLTSDICHLQHSLTIESSLVFDKLAFEADWTTQWSANLREEFILEGLVLSLRRLSPLGGGGGRIIIIQPSLPTLLACQRCKRISGNRLEDGQGKLPHKIIGGKKGQLPPPFLPLRRPWLFEEDCVVVHLTEAGI
ncbi:hypothetical protein B0H17DRAFT_1132035 [Mycena rosella]|uniref:Uncharacterized protein n=1 Tax=Mycena rosella TaxID=1033263 RepID=A0AAD7GLA7_MYCRO|nr:hypothetical protein B0H17DRAFT_1132035 [Mycena rosella]